MPGLHAPGTQGLLSQYELDRDLAGVQGTFGWSVQSGAVTFSAGYVFNVAAVAAGDCTVNSVTNTAYAGGTVTVTAADATNPRVDSVVITAAGAVSVVAGTPAGAGTLYAASSSGASPTSTFATSGPVPPTLTTSQLEIARIYVPANNTPAMSASSITDRRHPLPPSQFTWIRKAATETVNNSSTLQNDDDFTFTVTASHDYLVEMFPLFSSATATPDIKFAWTLVNMTWDGIYNNVPTASGSLITWMSVSAIASGSAQACTNANTPASAPIPMSFVIHSGATGGTLNFQWAQNGATVENTSLLKNSWLRYRDLGAS